MTILETFQHIENHKLTDNLNQPSLKKVKNKSESILAQNRRITTSQHNVPRHPLNIKPSGNAILASESELKKIGNSAGSLFKRLPDELILSILGLLNKDDLVSASKVSKFWYAYSTFDDIWRAMYTFATPEERTIRGINFKEWRGSWRNSILNLGDHNIPIVDCSGLVYSDALFTPYANACIDYKEVFSEIITEQKKLRDIDGYWDAKLLDNPSKFPYRGRIARMEESTFTYEMFEKNHWNEHPFILGSNSKTKRWPEWTTKYLLANFPDVTFRQESVLWKLSLYESYANQNMDESPLYLFDCRSNAMKSLLPTGYFEAPPVFAEKDLFKIFGDCRPDHSWLIAGPARSGSTFHKDPNSTDAWNVSIEGSKLWIMLPPEMKPPGVFVSDDESEVMSPIGLAEWVTGGYWNDTIQLSDEATLDTNDNKYGSGGFRTCVVGITFENECMYVPSGWWHTVINLNDSVAFTANFVPPCKIGKVLNFMKNKPDQVSGFRHDLLQKKIADFLTLNPGIDNSNVSLLKAYLLKKELGDVDEDVGELKGTECMPVFEAFTEFLLANGDENFVEKGLEQIKQENASLKKSQVWEKLTEDAKTKEVGGFSFGFDLDDD